MRFDFLMRFPYEICFLNSFVLGVVGEVAMQTHACESEFGRKGVGGGGS